VATTINERKNKHQGLQIPSDAGSRVAGPVAVVLYLYEDVPVEPRDGSGCRCFTIFGGNQRP